MSKDDYIIFNLSTQERQVAMQIGRQLSASNKRFMIKDVRKDITIKQNSHISAIVSRLVHKGLLSRVKRGEYEFNDGDSK